jgi:hypothetical protein
MVLLSVRGAGGVPTVLEGSVQGLAQECGQPHDLQVRYKEEERRAEERRGESCLSLLPLSAPYLDLCILFFFCPRSHRCT